MDEWKTDNVAWACHWPNKIRGHYSDFHFSQGGEVLWLVLDSMLEVHPDDRSSADYVHDEAQKILERMAGDELSDDSDEGAATPKPYEYSEASTLCLGIESGFGGLTSPLEGVVERSDEGHFGRRSIVAETISEDWEPSTGLQAQPSEILEIPGALPQGSIVNEQLWGSGPSRSKHVETDSVPRSACQESAAELREVGVRVAVEIPN